MSAHASHFWRTPHTCGRLPQALCFSCCDIHFSHIRNNLSQDIRHSAIIIMEMCKAPVPKPNALNKRSIAHIMYIKMEMLSAIKQKYIKKLTRNVDKGSSVTMEKMHAHTHAHTHTRMHTHTHTLQADRGERTMSLN